MIQPVAPGQPVSAAKINEIVAALNRADPNALSVSPPLFKTTQGGRVQIGMGSVPAGEVWVRITQGLGASAVGHQRATLLAADGATAAGPEHGLLVRCLSFTNMPSGLPVGYVGRAVKQAATLTVPAAGALPTYLCFARAKQVVTDTVCTSGVLTVTKTVVYSDDLN